MNKGKYRQNISVKILRKPIVTKHSYPERPPKLFKKKKKKKIEIELQRFCGEHNIEKIWEVNCKI